MLSDDFDTYLFYQYLSHTGKFIVTMETEKENLVEKRHPVGKRQKYDTAEKKFLDSDIS